MLTAETSTDAAASACGIVCGITPPPISKSPPTAVIPEIAFVIDIRGVCRAGFTPQTLWYPATTAREKVVSIEWKAGLVGQRTPKPTIEVRVAAMTPALCIYS
jgi:hypothetical protein